MKQHIYDIYDDGILEVVDAIIIMYEVERTCQTDSE